MKKFSGHKLAFLMGLSLSASVLMGAASPKEVTIEDNGREWVVQTGAKTVEELIKEQNLTADPGEVAFPSWKAEVTDKMKVQIKEGSQVVINDGGKVGTYSVTSRKVSDILKELAIELGPEDSIDPPLEAILKEDQGIKINRVVDEEREESQEIPFSRQENQNPNLYAGERKIVQGGQNGLIKKRVLYRLVNGEVRKSILLSSKVEKEALSEITEVGTKARENVIQGKRYSKKILMKGSAYDPSAGSRTAMGTRARVGAVAVDPRVIPLGSKLYIESTDGFPTYGFAVAEDTGGAIKGNRIDLFYNSNREANRFGRRNVTVYVLEPGQ